MTGICGSFGTNLVDYQDEDDCLMIFARMV